MDHEHKGSVKCTATSDVGKVDRISDLPDPLICHILSFLTSKESAVTSVLSTRWRYLFTSIPDIHLNFDHSLPPINNRDFSRYRLFSSFLSFSHRLLVSRNGAPIRKCKLSVWEVNEKCLLALSSLISAILACKVQQLEIYVRCWNKVTEVFPSLGIFMCKSLVVLQVTWGVEFNVADSISLPNLKKLELQRLCLVDEDSIRKIIQGCPLLEELYVFISWMSNKRKVTNVVVISSPSLKILRLCISGDECTAVVEASNLESLDYSVDSYKAKHEIIIKASNLKCLVFGGHEIIANFTRNLNSIVMAKLLVSRFSMSQDSVKLFNVVHTAKSLFIAENCLRDILYSQGTLLNLTCLELKDVTDTFLLGAIPRLMEIAPKLETLVLYQVHSDDFIELEEIELLSPEGILMCKEIIFKDFREKEREFKLVEYLLRNGKALEKMTFGISRERQFSVCKRLLSFKKCSEKCQIVFAEAQKMIEYWAP